MATRELVLVVDDVAEARESLIMLLSTKGYDVEGVASGEEAIERVIKGDIDLVLLDVDMPGKSGIEVLKELKSDDTLRFIPTILVTAREESEHIVAGFAAGADDYITKPFQKDELLARVKGASQKKKLYGELKSTTEDNKRLRRALGVGSGIEGIITNSPKMKEPLNLVDKVASATLPVLILGESGTGKELIAQAIHYHGNRKNNALVIQNCAALSEQLLESELFGHVKGSFTGAVKDKAGLFEAADGGSLFLDELGEMSLALQAKLLRAIQQGTFTPVGATQEKKVDVRVIAATNKDLKKAIADKTFREDLYYRLAAVVIKLPPLRDRVEDISVLATFFLKKYPGKKLTTESLARLVSYPWPGNIRQLQNEIERAVIMSGERDELLPVDFSEELTADGSVARLLPSGKLKEAIALLEKEMIHKTLTETSGNKSEASRVLGLSRSSLISKVKEYQLSAWDQGEE
jgi:DNA-binding NtrC family response regulator